MTIALERLRKGFRTGGFLDKLESWQVAVHLSGTALIQPEGMKDAES